MTAMAFTVKYWKLDAKKDEARDRKWAFRLGTSTLAQLYCEVIPFKQLIHNYQSKNKTKSTDTIYSIPLNISYLDPKF